MMRACEHCGQPVLRRDGESPSHHRLRRTCSTACAKALRDRLAAAATRKRFGSDPGNPYGPARHCMRCGVEIVKEGRPSAYRRRACCRACRRLAAGDRAQKRRCLACGRLLTRREDERQCNFRARKTCGAECADVARRASKEELIEYREMAQYRQAVDWRHIFAGQDVTPDALDGAPLRGIRSADRRTYGGVST